MIVKWNLVDIQLQSPLKLHKNFPIRSIQMLEFRSRRRRKLKRNTFSVCNQLSSSSSSEFENLFQNLLVQFPSINSLDLLAPALGFASGVALYLSNSNKFSNSNSSFNHNRNLPERPNSDSGEWILYTSPTPFNRFVTLRCPSIVFRGNELREDVNEKLVKEDSHLVRLNGLGKQSDVDEIVTELEYQRVCVSAEDSGVISLDWPANLDLTEERGFDTTILLVPGTVQGSMNENIRAFVFECLKSGCFPVVMNPRGCAGSPVTTPRLFSAADSDDVCTTIQFINKARPWTTLMGVGWGYGANMLTKYLAEVGEKTPLTAATCIDNPFDLQEAGAQSTYHVVDQELTCGLVDILQSNKELFQGRAKGFDVEKALAATSIRDFEKAISMVSHGFDSIEDFYKNSNTRDVVDNVKIPLLFIQNDDGAVPLLSIPRSLIAENPFTSVLMCSRPPKTIDTNGAPSWCQHLIIEWLTAVELGVLKGRHPLLEDVDVAIDAKRGLQLMEGRSSKKSSSVNNILNIPHLGAFRGNMLYPLTNEMPEESETAAVIHSSSGQDAQRKYVVEYKGLQLHTNEVVKQASPVDNQVLDDGKVDPVDSEKGHVLQTTEVVMNMLDVAMPKTLSDEQKKKVLAAVGRGETVMKALQDVVPEDVRGKLTDAVSEIVRSQRSNIKLRGLGSISQITDVTSGLNSKIQKKLGISTSEGGTEDPSEEKKGVSGLSDHSNKNHGTEYSAVPVESEFQTSESFQKPMDSNLFQTSNHGGDPSNPAEKSSKEIGSHSGSAYSSGEKSSEYHRPDSGANPEFSNQSENAGGSEDLLTGQNQVVQEVGTASPLKDDNTAQQTNDADSTVDLRNMSSTTTEDSLSSSSSSLENKSLEKESSEHTAPNQSNFPALGVSQALDALTGIDDSTQVAVNSVFSVIEGMITQLEENRDDGTEMKEQINGSESEDAQVVNEEKKDGEDDVEVPSYKSNDLQLYSGSRKVESLGNSISCGIKVPAENGDNVILLDNDWRNIQQSMNKFPHGDPLHNEYLRNYVVSTMADEDSLDSDTTTALFLDYIPEEGKWKLLEEHTSDGNDSSDKVTVHENIDVEFQTDLPLQPECIDNIIEPAYLILHTEMEHELVRKYAMKGRMKGTFEIGDDALENLMFLVKKNIHDSLKVEICRRIRATEMKEIEPNLSKELEHIVNAVSVAIVNGKEHIMMMEGEGYSSVKAGSLHGEHVIGALSVALQDTRYIRRVLPVGVILGSSLAALRKFSNGAAADISIQSEANPINTVRERYYFEADEIEIDQLHSSGADQNNTAVRSLERYEDSELKSLNNDATMVGAVTAAIGASALINRQQDPYRGSEVSRTSSMFDGKENLRGPEQHEETEKKEHNIVASLAEKAMSVAGPVVPTKEDGEVDQDRLVAILADLGQKGGFLKLIGKIALLWGGIRGAMSLIDKLITFLRIAERPLLQRILAFACLVLVLWTPVVVPLLPTIVQNWATRTTSKFAELTCIIGLYISIMLLVMLWGKRIRGYEDPLERYGLELKSSRQVQNLFFGLIGGVMLVLFIHSLNALLGCVSLSWPTTPTSLDGMTSLKVYGKVFAYFGRGLVTATGLALVEELLFRSWLPDEIAVDLGYHRGVILAGLMFSLSQRSIWAVPGLWLLSLGLAGARQRSHGNLSLPIGLRAGIMASSFVLQMGGFLTYRRQHNFPAWVSGTHLFQPFSGVVGLTVALFWAILLYPRQPLQSIKIARRISE